MNTPSFSADWFSQNIAPLTEVLAKFKGQPNVHALEIGCFEGKGTLWLLDNILTGEGCFIDCIDTFQGSAEHEHFKISFNDVYERFMANVSDRKKVRMVHMDKSHNVLMRLAGAGYDIAYIDGSHMAPDVLSDMVLSWPLLKKGGVMFCDDYKWPGTDNIEQHRPEIAIFSFVKIFSEQLKVLHSGYSVAFEKL